MDKIIFKLEKRYRVNKFLFIIAISSKKRMRNAAINKSYSEGEFNYKV